jgi:hypothetical protein
MMKRGNQSLGKIAQYSGHEQKVDTNRNENNRKAIWSFN